MSGSDPLEESGASAAAIQAHYDTGNAFFAQWLDRSLTYSCALWDGPDDTLEAAQLRKLDFHIDAARAAGASRVLDIGCGWGSGLNRLSQRGTSTAVGLTLAKEQKAFVDALRIPGASVRLERWEEHAPDAPYDAIISIGAIEHFVKPSDPHDVRVATYRRFFETCRDLLVPGGRLSLQTSTYGVGGFVTGAVAEIFPESDLPRLAQLAEAAEGVLDVVQIVNHRDHYARTCAAWADAMAAHRAGVVAASNEETYQRYYRYLRAAVKGFDMRIFTLLRLTFERMDG